MTPAIRAVRTTGRTPVRARSRRQRGFSLIEAVCALLIFATGVLGITRLQSVAVQETGTATFRTQASLLARNLIAQMWLSDRTPTNFRTNFDSGVGGAGYTAWKAAVLASGLPGTAANPPSVSVSPVAGGGTTPVASNLVSVIVYWKAPGDLSVHSYTETAQIK